MGDVVSGGIGLINQGTGGLFGTGSDSGVLGTGQYRTDGAKIDRSAFDPNADENALIKAMQDQVYGRTQNIALQQGLDGANNQALALAASQRGINPALAARLASQQQAANTQAANIAGVQLQQQQQNNLMSEYQNVRKGRQDREALESGNFNAAANINAQAYEGAANRRQNMMQGLSQGFGMMGGMGMAKGGLVQHLAMGGMPTMQMEGDAPENTAIDSGMYQPQQAQAQAQQTALMPKFTQMPVSDDFNQMLSSINNIAAKPITITPLKEAGGKDKGGGGGMGDMLKGVMSLAALLSEGGQVPGEAKVKGDSYANDTVPTMLSPGEIVIPRTVVEQSKKNPQASAKFVAAVLRGEKGA